MKINSTRFYSVVMLASLLVGCGKAQKQEVSEVESIIEDAEEAAARAAATGDNIQGRYVAHFNTLNPHVNGDIPGSAVFVREDNRLKAFVRYTLGSPSVGHFQNVHMGKRCPQLPQDDTNGDGFIDIQEALTVVGPVIIPLDSDISSQRSANRFWPKAFENGSYTWQEITSFKHFWNDLKSKDWDEKDNITKLAEDQGLAITGKVVMIQGVGEKPVYNATTKEYEALPATVASHKRYPSYVTFPTVCGIYMPENEEPGTVYSEGIPPEIGTAPVEEGQDRPAPEGAGEIPGNGTIYEGPTNDSDNSDSDDTTVDETGSTTGSSTTGSTGSSTTGTTGSGSTTGGSTTGGSTTGGSTTGGSTTGSTGNSGRTTGSSTSGSTGSTGSTTGTTTGSTGNYGDDEDDDDGGIDWPWED